MLRQHEKYLPVITHHTGIPLLPRMGKGVMTSRQSVLTLQVGSALDPGIERKQEPNEDTICITRGSIPSAASKPFALFLVADGMGGHGHGQEASQLARDALVEYITHALRSEQVEPKIYLPLLKAAIQYANHIVYQRNRDQNTAMGTTMTVCLVVEATAYVAHVGDSRCYLYRERGGLLQVTQDHSIVAALVGAGMVKQEDIYTHPNRNLIYRYVGEKANVEVDTYEMPLVAGDTLLLCSDGLWEMVRDPQIATLLAARVPDPTRAAHAFIQAALENGGVDNVSAIVVQVDKGELQNNTGRPDGHIRSRPPAPETAIVSVL